MVRQMRQAADAFGSFSSFVPSVVAHTGSIGAFAFELRAERTRRAFTRNSLAPDLQFRLSSERGRTSLLASPLAPTPMSGFVSRGPTLTLRSGVLPVESVRSRSLLGRAPKCCVLGPGIRPNVSSDCSGTNKKISKRSCGASGLMSVYGTRADTRVSSIVCASFFASTSSGAIRSPCLKS